MSMIQIFIKELDQESITSRKMLKRVPEEQFQWRPHPKSMTVLHLATHVAELPSWVSMTLTTDELDFGKNPYTPEPIRSSAALLDYFEKCLADAKSQLLSALDEQLSEKWTLRNGEVIYQVATKGEIIRMAYSQVIHHRAQLGVFLRLLNIPIPGSYGPSADEPDMNF